MIIILSLLVAALAAMGVAVATKRWPLIAVPLAGAVTAALLVAGALLWLISQDVAAAASAACGVVAFTWGVRVWLAYDARLRAAELDQLAGRQDFDPDSSAAVRHEIAVDNITGGAR